MARKDFLPKSLNSEKLKGENMNLNAMAEQVTTDDQEKDKVMTLPGEGEQTEATDPTNVPTENTEESAGGTETTEETATEEVAVADNLTNMTAWAKEFIEAANEHVKILSVKVKSVDPDESIILTMPHPSGGTCEDNTPKRVIRQIENSNVLPVINLPGEAIAFFSNTAFMIVHSTEREDVKIKYYGMSARQAVFCQVVNGMLIPYAIKKIKKNDKNLEMIEPPAGIANMMVVDAPKEDLLVRYKQIEKSLETITSVEDAMKFFMEKSANIVDINHLLHIDNVIIKTVNG